MVLITPSKRFVTGASRVISVHSTGPAQSSLTSEIGRDRVYSGWYERIMCSKEFIRTMNAVRQRLKKIIALFDHCSEVMRKKTMYLPQPLDTVVVSSRFAVDYCSKFLHAGWELKEVPLPKHIGMPVSGIYHVALWIGTVIYLRKARQVAAHSH